jgi:hypothetical protein
MRQQGPRYPNAAVRHTVLDIEHPVVTQIHPCWEDNSGHDALPLCSRARRQDAVRTAIQHPAWVMCIEQQQTSAVAHSRLLINT